MELRNTNLSSKTIKKIKEVMAINVIITVIYNEECRTHTWKRAQSDFWRV